jgi:putative inorganic carbon (HCO3(-)) transporter
LVETWFELQIPRKHAQVHCICRGLENRLVKQHFKTAAGRIADLELVIVLLGVAPVLLFDAWVPSWAIAVALAAIPALWFIRWLGCGSPIRPTPLDLPILLLLLMVPVGVWAAAINSLNLPQIYRIVLGAGLYYAAVGTLTSARRLWRFSAWLLIAVPVLALIALLGTQLSSSKFPLLAALYDWIPSSIKPFWRPTGLGPNSVAGGLVMLLPLTIGFALGGRRQWLRIACALASLFAGSVLLLTQSRGALVGLALALLVMFILWKRWFLLAIPAVIMAGLAALGVLGAEWLGEFMLSSTATSAAASFDGRLEIWTRAIYMIQDFPITGVGLGMFDHIMDLLYPLFMVAPETNIFHPHNVFLWQAVSSGLPGLVGLLALIFLMLFMAAQSTRLSRQGESWPLALGLLGALVAYLVHGTFDSPTSFVRASAILWILFGLQAALWLHLRKRQAINDSAGQVSAF